MRAAQYHAEAGGQAVAATARFAEKDASLLPEVERHLRALARPGSKALSTRARYIRQRLSAPDA